MIPLKRLALLAIAALALSGCTPGEEAPRDSEPAPSASVAPSEGTGGGDDDGDSEEPAGLSLPATCSELVPIEWIRAELDPSFQEIPVAASGSGPVADDFLAREGLACLWGIPQSEGGVRLNVAVRTTASDEEQVTQWRSAGFTECPPFLDACWFEPLETPMGDYIRVHALVEGYELWTEGFGNQPDPYMSFIRQATDSMGYL